MMDDTKSLSDVGFTSGTARAQSPAEIGLAIKVDGAFEELNLSRSFPSSSSCRTPSADRRTGPL